MLTDVLSADKDEEVSRGEDEDRQVRHCVLAKALNLFLSNFIPADRCLAGQNIRVTGERGGQREGGNEDDLQGGIKEGHAVPPLPTPWLSLLHWSGNDRFHSCFRSWRGEVVSDYQGGTGGADVELRPRCVRIGTTLKVKSEQCRVGKPGGERILQEGNQGHILIIYDRIHVIKILCLELCAPFWSTLTYSISTTIWWIFMKFCTDIHGPQRMYPGYFSDHLTFL